MSCGQHAPHHRITHFTYGIACGIGSIILTVLLPLYVTSENGLNFNPSEWADMMVYRMWGKTVVGFFITALIHAVGVSRLNAFLTICTGLACISITLLPSTSFLFLQTLILSLLVESSVLCCITEAQIPITKAEAAIANSRFRTALLVSSTLAPIFISIVYENKLASYEGLFNAIGLILIAIGLIQFQRLASVTTITKAATSDALSAVDVKKDIFHDFLRRMSLRLICCIVLPTLISSTNTIAASYMVFHLKQAADFSDLAGGSRSFVYTTVSSIGTAMTVLASIGLEYPLKTMDAKLCLVLFIFAIGALDLLLSASSTLPLCSMAWIVHSMFLKVSGTPFSMLVGSEAKASGASIPMAFSIQKVCSGCIAALLAVIIKQASFLGGSGVGEQISVEMILAGGGLISLPAAGLLMLLPNTMPTNVKQD